MKIERFVSYDIFRDGGTFSCSIQFSDGERERYGIDGRIRANGVDSDRTIFRKAKWIGDPGVELLVPNSKEEIEFLSSLVTYLDQKCGFLRREALAQLEQGEVVDKDISDYIAVRFFSLIGERSKARSGF